MNESSAARALRKELLVMRCGVERIELAEAGQALRASVALPQVLRSIAPGLLARGSLPLLPMLMRLVTRLPWLGTRAARLAQDARRRPAFTLALRAGGLALVAWQVWRTVDAVRRAMRRR